MEKKVKFSDKPMTTKIIYGVVIAILCITAIVIGVVSAAQKTKDIPDDTPPVTDGTGDQNQGDGTQNGTGNGNGDQNGDQSGDKTPKPLSFVSPAKGTVMTAHDLEIPVFSLTLGEWRVHAGIDIATEEDAPVYASEGGTVSGVYSDPKLGYTVEITHSEDLKTRYSNLSSEDAGLIKVGDTVESGDRIGTVGDSSISELAEEPHLHFEVLYKGAKVNPLDYINEDSKESSLGIPKTEKE